MLPWGKGNPRGTIRLNLPVSYQNLLDGVIQFIVSDGHGGTQTVAPVAYAPNNDLYVSADQGGFEITNVHPGNSVYSELVLSGNWSGSGKSLLNIVVAGGPRVTGINGLVSWSDENTVVHEDVNQDVKVYFEDNSIDAKIILVDRFGVTSEYSAIGGIIQISSSDLTDVVNRRLSLKLVIDNEDFSEIIFLPEIESEDFNLEGFINDAGTFVGDRNYLCTDFVDVYDGNELVITNKTGGAARALVGYNEDKTFNSVILDGYSYTNRHVPLDGSIRYVRACGFNNYTLSLKLYFRTRG